MAIHYNRRSIRKMQDAEVVVDTQEEMQRVMSYLLTEGYNLRHSSSMPEKDDTRIRLYFVKSATVADTMRGDKVALNGEFELKDKGK